jgi:hypothetical protein
MSRKGWLFLLLGLPLTCPAMQSANASLVTLPTAAASEDLCNSA